MLIMQELISSLITLTTIFFSILYWMLVIRIVLSWFGVNPHTTYNELLGALYHVTDMILLPFRRLPLQIGMLDLSPIVAFVALQFAQHVLVRLLYALGGMLG